MQGFNPDYSNLMQTGQNQANLLANVGAQVGGMIADKRQRSQQDEAQSQMMNEINQGLKSGDPLSIAQLSIKYPQMSEQIKGAFGFMDEATEGNFRDTNFAILSDPSNTEKYLNERISFLESVGGDTSQPMARLEMYRKNPEQFLKTTEGITSAMYGPQYKSWSESQRSGEPEKMTEYQSAMVKNKEEENRLRALENEQKILDRQLKRETDEVKREELQRKIEESKAKTEQAIATKDASAIDAYQAGQDTLDLIDRIESHPGFSSYVGAKGASSLFGLKDEPVAGSEAASVAGMIETLSSKNFMNSIQQMKGMGALSDAEGKKVSSAIESLNPNMKEADFKRSLNVIRDITKRGMDKQSKILGDKAPSKSLSDDELLKKYL